MKKYKGKCNIIPAHLTSQALDYCTNRINPPTDLMVLDTNDAWPYDFRLNNGETVDDYKDFIFEKEKFETVVGNIVDLSLSSTKHVFNGSKQPTYSFNVLLHNTSTIIGAINYCVVPTYSKEHNGNISFVFNEGYDLKSVKYESCQLIKQVAKHHGATNLFLTCSPKDLKSRKVYESLGATLKEIKTYTFINEEKKRDIIEDCIWDWTI